MRIAAKTTQMTVTTPAGKPGQRQIWAMAFMRQGLLVCSPALVGMHETPPASRHGSAANCNYAFAIVS